MKVIVGMSGGVDSSVAALKLIDEGYYVTGLFMKNWEEDDFGNCSSSDDYNDALLVCKRLKIPLKTLNFSKEYMEKVFNVSLEQFQRGFTPNPDILCNQEIKFKCFFESAMQMGADYIATGHYAKVEKSAEGYILKKAHDHNKDQTYFLYTIPKETLEKVLFPIGDMTKQEVREMAKDNKLPNFNKKDSTGLCFIGERNFKNFLETYLLKRPGNIIDVDGNVLGKHDGLMFYTIGQRSGLKIGGQKNYPEKPWYVLKKIIKQNELIVGQDHNHPLLMGTKLTCGSIHWITKKIEYIYKCKANIRYRQESQNCTITPVSQYEANVCFDSPQRAITKGQSIVFYDGDICLGGGIII